MIKYKARLVAQGFHQIQGVDFTESYAPVSSAAAVRAAVALATAKDLEITHLDVAQAFLNAKIDSEVYVAPTDGDPDYSSKDFVFKLNRALYRLSQSPMLWAKTLREFLINIGFKVVGYEGATYRLEKDGMRLILVTYVDDLQLIYHRDHTRLADEVIKAFADKFKITNEGDLTWHLGIHYVRDREKRVTVASQEQYLESVLERFGYQDLKPRSTPMIPNTRLVKALETELLSEDETRLFREQLGCLMYLSTMTRLDISFVCSELSKFMQNPGQEHLAALKRVFRYLSGTRSRGLIFHGNPDEKSVLMGYSDADWSNDPATSKSVSRLVFMLHGAAISWRSKGQEVVAMSTAEAELIAASRAAQEALYLRHLLRDLGYEQVEATTIYEDNDACIAMSKHPVQRDKCRHFDSRDNFLHDLTAKGHVLLLRKGTKEMVADVLTKALARIDFKRHVSTAMGSLPTKP